MFAFFLWFSRSATYCYKGSSTEECPSGSIEIEAFANITEASESVFVLVLDEGFVLDDHIKHEVTIDGTGKSVTYIPYLHYMSPVFVLKNLKLNISTTESEITTSKLEVHNVTLLNTRVTIYATNLFIDINSLSNYLTGYTMTVLAEGDVKDDLNVTISCKTININASYQAAFIESSRKCNIFQINDKNITFTQSGYELTDFNIYTNYNLKYIAECEDIDKNIKVYSYNSEVEILSIGGRKREFYLHNSTLKSTVNDSGISIRVEEDSVVDFAYPCRISGIYLNQTTLKFAGDSVINITSSLEVRGKCSFESEKDIFLRKGFLQVSDDSSLETQKDFTFESPEYLILYSPAPNVRIIGSHIHITKRIDTIMPLILKSFEVDCFYLTITSLAAAYPTPDIFEKYVKKNINVVSAGEYIKIGRVEFSSGQSEEVDPWTRTNEFWTNERITYSFTQTEKELNFTLLENPFYTYLRVYYTNETTKKYLYGACVITPENMTWWEHVSEYTKGVTIYFAHSNALPIPFPEQPLKHLVNLTFTPSIFESGEFDIACLLLDSKNIENACANFTITFTTINGEKSHHFNALKLTEGMHYFPIDNFNIDEININVIDGNFSFEKTKNAGGYWKNEFMHDMNPIEALNVWVPQTQFDVYQGEVLTIDFYGTSIALPKANKYIIYAESNNAKYYITEDSTITPVVFYRQWQSKLTNTITLKKNYTRPNPVLTINDLYNKTIIVSTYGAFPLSYASKDVHMSYAVINSLNITNGYIYPFEARSVKLYGSTNCYITADITSFSDDLNKFQAILIYPTYHISSKKGAEIYGSFEKLELNKSGNITIKKDDQRSITENTNVSIVVNEVDFDQIPIVTITDIDITIGLYELTVKNTSINEEKKVVVVSNAKGFSNNIKLHCIDFDEIKYNATLQVEGNDLILSIKENNIPEPKPEPENSKNKILKISLIVSSCVAIVVIAVVVVAICIIKRRKNAYASVSETLRSAQIV